MTTTTATPAWVEYAIETGFDSTLARLVAAIEAGGMTVFARIDHAAGARAAGLAMPPTVLLIYGNAKGGTPIMLNTPPAALELPLKILLRQTEHGRTLLAFHPIRPLLEAAGVSEELAARLEPAERLLVRAIRP